MLHKIGAILLLAVFTISCATKSGMIHPTTVSADDAQDAFSSEQLAEAPKVAKSANKGCRYFAEGKKLSHRYFMDMGAAQVTDMDSINSEMDGEMDDMDKTDSRLGFDVMLSVEPLESTIKNGITSQLFRLDVTDVILVDNAGTIQDTASKVKLLQLLGGNEDDDSADMEVMIEKFMGFSFFYRQNCDGEFLEVHPSPDEAYAMVIAKKMMAVSFFQSQTNPVSSVPTTQEWNEDHEEEDLANLEDNQEEVQVQYSEDDDLEDDSMQGEEDIIYDEDKEEAIDEDEPSTGHSDADRQIANEDIEVDISEAKQAIQHASSHSKKSSDALNVEGKTQGKPSSQDAEKCELTPAKLSNEMNETCAVNAKMRVVRPRS